MGVKGSRKYKMNRFIQLDQKEVLKLNDFIQNKTNKMTL